MAWKFILGCCVVGVGLLLWLEWPGAAQDRAPAPSGAAAVSGENERRRPTLSGALEQTTPAADLAPNISAPAAEIQVASIPSGQDDVKRLAPPVLSENGLVLEEKVSGPDGRPITKRNAYDEEGRLRSSKHLHESGEVEVWSYAYHADGKISVRITDAKGNVRDKVTAK